MLKRFARMLFLAGAFCVGFAAVAAVFSHTVTQRHVRGVSARLKLWAARPEFDTILIGSSRMNRQVIQRTLDAAMARDGFPIRSCNLSSDGMRPPEDGFVLDQALAARRAPLKLIIVEINPIELTVTETDADTDRVVYWHDTTRMQTLWSRAWAADLEGVFRLDKRITDTWRNLRHFAGHFRYWIWSGVRAGRGSDMLLAALNVDAAIVEDADEIGPNQDGAPGFRADDSMSVAETREYQTKLRKYAESRVRSTLGDHASQAELVRKATAARSRGARLVLVAPPAARERSLRPLKEVDAIFLDYTDPQKYPALFLPEHRRDPGHLNEKGAEIYTRQLAEDLSAALRAVGTEAEMPRVGGRW